jgi:hypothetical protein
VSRELWTAPVSRETAAVEMSHQSSTPDGRQGVEFSARLPKIGRGRHVRFIRGGRWEEASRNSQDPDLCRPPERLKRRQGPRGPTRGGVWPLTVKVWPTVPCVSGVEKQGPRAHAHRRNLGDRLRFITCRSATSRTGQSAVNRRVLGARGGRTMPSCPPVSAGFMGRRIVGRPIGHDGQPNHSRRRDRRPAGRPIAGLSTGTADGSPAVDRSTISRPHPDSPVQAIAPRPPQHSRTAARRNRGPRSAGPSTTAPRPPGREWRHR